MAHKLADDSRDIKFCSRGLFARRTVSRILILQRGA